MAVLILVGYFSVSCLTLSCRPEHHILAHNLGLLRGSP